MGAEFLITLGGAIVMGASEILGGMGSSTQFMLDMEIRKSGFALKDRIQIDDETLVIDKICDKVREGADFLS